MKSTVLVFVVAMVGAPAYGQTPTPLVQIRDLYSNAAYEDVLAAVARDASASPEIGQYKVFSLIALGRPADAEKAVEAVLTAHPGFHPDSDASPRLVELFAKVRRRVAPDLVKSMYVEAKSCLDRKDREAAISAFTELVAITDDPDLKDDKTVAEVGLLANGFLDLSRALPAAPPPPAASAIETGKSTPDTPAGKSSSPRTGVAVTPPTVIQEVLPRWLPPATLARAEYRGKILVHIGVDGKVVGSELIAPVHPLYDEQLLKASKSWTYKPGLSDGTPVPSERIVEVVLKPRGPAPH
jgi:hypothetical protein